MNSSSASLERQPLADGAWLVLFLVSLSYFNLYLDRSLLNYVQRPMAEELQLFDTAETSENKPGEPRKLNDGWIGLLTPGFFIPYALAQLFVGYLGDRWPRKRVILLALAGTGLMLVCCGFVQSFWQLLLFRVGMALFQAPAIPAFSSALADCFPTWIRSTAIGLYLAAYNMALVVAGKYGGMLSDTEVWRIPLPGGVYEVSGWRMAMFVFAGVAWIAAITVAALFLEPKRTERVAGVGLGAGGGNLAQTSLAVLRIPTYYVISVQYLCSVLAVNVTATWLARYYKDFFLLTQEQAGWWATIGQQPAQIFGLLAGGPLADYLSRRLIAGRTLVQILGFAIAAPSLAVLGLADSLDLSFVASIGFGLGMGLYYANLWTTTFEVVDPAARATAIGFLNVTAGLLGSWITFATGRYQADFGGLGRAIAAMGLFLGLGLLVMLVNIRWFLPHDYRDPRPTPRKP